MSADKSNRDMNNKKGKALVGRTVLLLAICGVVAFAALSSRLYKLQIKDNSYYESLALTHQLSYTTISASRGTIYDINGDILAISAIVENVFISPFEIHNEDLDINLIADGLSSILDIPREPIIDLSKLVDSQYQIVKLGVMSSESERLREFIRDNRLSGIYFESTPKRYYPNNSLAGHVLGFVGSDYYGLDGLEQRYNSLLTGVDGRVVRLRNGNESELLFTEYDDYFDARDGNDITLTIDSGIQYYVQKHLEQAIHDYDVINGASCIVMNAKTGAILALANYPYYDPNNFLRLSDRDLERLSIIDDEDEYAKAYYLAQLEQWRNRSLTDTYEPGSVFKIMTLAMALEENVATLHSQYDCRGSIAVRGREEDDDLHCWNIYGHGQQALAEAVQNSCNIATVEMAQQVGAQAFYKYIEAFGLFDKTGLDNIIEGRSLWWDDSVFLDRYNQSQLASASFGQTFKVTPIQMISAAAAVINGGYLMQPYIVQQVADSNGAIVEVAEPTMLRQVISSETSSAVRDILESVVNEGTGKNAQVRGYRVGGKTGTSENVEQLSAEEEDAEIVKDYIVSFLGFAPADDPEIIVLLLLDTPSHETGIYISGGAMAAPVVGNMLADILPLSLRIRPQYTEDDIMEINIDMPRVTGKTVEEAQAQLAELGFEVRVIGDGGSVIAQLPTSNAYVASGTTVMLYTEEEPSREFVEVPNLLGLSYSTAKNMLESNGMFIRTSGAPRFDGRTEISIQSIPGGELTVYGSTIEVTLINRDAVARN